MREKNYSIGNYVVKKVIAEIRHRPILSHSTLVRQKLDKHVKLFDRVTVTKPEGVEESFQMFNKKEYFMFVSEWTRVAFIIENCESIAKASEQIKKIFLPISDEIGIKEYQRIGLRVVFLLPFEGNFEKLVEYYNEKVFKDLKIFNSYGNIEDVGVSALTIKDSNYKINFSFGPFKKEEIKIKISEFKEFDKDMDCAFMLDVDLYDDNLQNYKIGTFFADALEAARIKTVKFREQLLN